MKYREDIDGLRSVAVTLVVLHHAGFNLLSGGYVGVDVFFVISGYLITGIIYQKASAGNFSFVEFYVRRIRRLMPALFAVMFITAILATLFLFPSDLVRFGWSLIWVAFYLGNLFFWREHGGYFFENTQEAPLLHTWSLAVEEQYYLLWPLYIFLGLKFFGEKYFAFVTGIGLVAAIFLSEWATQNTIGAAYYLLPTRFFELMIGSLLAIYWTRLPQFGQLLNHVFSLTGLALILGPALILTPASSFPGYNAIFPAVGSALLIYSGEPNRGIVNRLLSLRPFVFVGLLSYSLYLWHWPIFVFLNYTSVTLTPIVQLTAISGSVLLAYFSWRYIETPFRKPRDFNLPKTSYQLIAKPLVVILVFSFTFIVFDGLRTRFSHDINNMDIALNSKPHENREICHSAARDYERLPSETCLLGNLEGDLIQGFLFGDSHANHITGFIHILAADAGVAVQDYTMDQCPPIFGLAWGRTAQIASACLQRNEIARQHLLGNDFEFVVLSASWPYAGSDRVFKDEIRLPPLERQTHVRDLLEATISQIIEVGAIPILFDDVPSVIDQDPRCPIKKAAYDNTLICETARVGHYLMEQYFSELEKIFPQLVRMSPGDLYCEQETCSLAVNGFPVYHDRDHLNEPAAMELGRMQLQRNFNPFEIDATSGPTIN